MSLTVFKIEIGTTELEKVAESLSKITPEALGGAALRAVNHTVESAYDLARSHMIANINLSDAYIQSHMRVDPATDLNNPVAEIVTTNAGTTDAGRGSTLSPTYGAKLSVVAVKHPKRSKGWAKMGIPAGMKAAGFDVSVKKSESAHFQQSASGGHYSFLAPFGGYKFGVTRLKGVDPDAKGAMQVLRGPSPYQLFKATVPHIYSQVEADLSKALSAEVDVILKGIV